MKSAGVIFMLLAPFVQGQPNIVVESEGNPLAAGATVDFGKFLVFGTSDPVQQFGQDGTTVTIPGLPPGTYQIERSNDGIAEWGLLIPGTPHAGGDLSFEDEELNFSFAFFYRARSNEATRSFTVRNTGTSALEKLEIGTAPEDMQVFDFDVNAFGFPASVEPGESASFEVYFLPFELGERSVTLRISSNDPDAALFTIQLAGEGVAQGSGGDPPLPVLEDVVVVPATALLPARLSGMVSGGAAGAEIGVEASTDLGFADPWVEIGSVTLDSNGSAAIDDLSDSGSVGAVSNFFRLTSVR